MLGIQNYSQCSMQSKPSFRSDMAMDREQIEAEMGNISSKYDDDAKGWNELADNLEKSDSKFSKKMGKGARFIASVVGLIGTFAVTKYSSKLAIETIKNLAKSGPAKSIVDSLKGLKKPIVSVLNKIKNVVKGEQVQSIVSKLKSSKIGTKISAFLKNPKVQTVLAPVKTTLESIKMPKLDAKRIQTVAENVMAGTAAASVAVDNLTGRNKDKNALELALA